VTLDRHKYSKRIISGEPARGYDFEADLVEDVEDNEVEHSDLIRPPAKNPRPTLQNQPKDGAGSRPTGRRDKNPALA